jgi:hypothetical protein
MQVIGRDAFQLRTELGRLPWRRTEGWQVFCVMR